jgi:non-heme Fe2+,alpha-ketoglutarate-dependent halogenase
MALVEQYNRDGYYFPLDVLSENEADAARAQLQRAEAQFCANPHYGAFGAYPHMVMPWLDELMRNELILRPVRELLGEDLLVWGTSFFIKEAQTTSLVSWHQDLHYWGLDDVHETTAWVALSPATLQSGCMRFVPGTHRSEDLEHIDSFSAENLLSRGQELVVDVDESSAADVVLRPGQMSLHHGRTFHASRPNQSDDRRIGVAIRYIPTSMAQAGGARTMATLVSGKDQHDHFTLSPPRGFLDAGDLARVAQAETLKESILYRSAAKAGHRHHAPSTSQP